ncbi:DinB family protein [Catelliglobosispora koreensis]|uniref:DinB family protein n=1 Tax=Catelliglobosispora koreensis TaxID=129052 RepID=UPI00037C632B|nr:DinB family protein [Catelliglobosispora koreensis]
MDIRSLVLGQLEFYWDNHLWPRLQGLTDDEYVWEPFPPNGPPTIAWRMTHVSVDIFYTRADAFFGGSGTGDMFDPSRFPKTLPEKAADALALLERSYTWWREGIAALDDKALWAPLGPKGAYFQDEPMAALVQHLNRETMHHGGEICLLRDLYRARGQ